MRCRGLVVLVHPDAGIHRGTGRPEEKADSDGPCLSVRN